jgi:hypothetical protein
LVDAPDVRKGQHVVNKTADICTEARGVKTIYGVLTQSDCGVTAKMGWNN